jgi:Zn-finger domain-containing protein
MIRPAEKAADVNRVRSAIIVVDVALANLSSNFINELQQQQQQQEECSTRC